MVKKADLILNGSLATPTRRDTITVDSIVYRYSTTYEDLLDTGEFQIPVEEVV